MSAQQAAPPSRRNSSAASGTAAVHAPAEVIARALAVLDKARAAGDAVATGEAGIAAAYAVARVGDLDSAARYVESALAAFEGAGQHRRLGAAYKLHAMIFVSQDKAGLALTAALKALGYPDLTTADRATLFMTIASCFLHLIDMPSGARVLLDYAWPEAERSGDAATIVGCATRCAGAMHDFACWAKGIAVINTVGAEPPQLTPAAHYLDRAARFVAAAEAHATAVAPADRAWLLAHKAKIANLVEGWPAALALFEQAEREAADVPRQQALLHLAIGSAARIAGETEVALRRLMTARTLPAARSAHTQRNIAWELVQVYEALGQHERALEEMRTFADLQTRKTRIASEWIDDPDARRRYGGRFELSVAKEVVFGKVQPAPLKRAIEYIERNLGERLALTDVARHAAVSTRTLQNLFRSHHGVPASDFIRERRMQRADELLKRGHVSVGKIAELAGYSNPANFSRDYRRRFGRAPSSVRGVRGTA